MIHYFQIPEKQNATYRIKLDNIEKSVDEEMRHIEDDEGEFTFRFGGGPTDSRSEFDLFNYHPLEKSIPSSPATSEGVFTKILHRLFGIFNKIDTLFVLSLTILP